MAYELRVTSGYSICVLEATLRRDGERLRPTKREFEILAFLAFRGRAVSMFELAEAIVPSAATLAQAANRLRVAISRMRSKFGPDLVSTNKGYALGTHVTDRLDLVRRRIEAASAANGPNGSRLLAALRDDLLAIEAYLAQPSPEYAWRNDLGQSLDYLARSIRGLLPAPPPSHTPPTSPLSARRGAMAAVVALALVLGGSTDHARSRPVIASVTAPERLPPAQARLRLPDPRRAS